MSYVGALKTLIYMCSPDDLDILELVDEELVPAVDVGVLHDPSRHVIVSRDTGSCCVWKIIKKKQLADF